MLHTDKKLLATARDINNDAHTHIAVYDGTSWICIFNLYMKSAKDRVSISVRVQVRGTERELLKRHK